MTVWFHRNEKFLWSVVRFSKEVTYFLIFNYFIDNFNFKFDQRGGEKNEVVEFCQGCRDFFRNFAEISLDPYKSKLLINSLGVHKGHF